MDLVDTTQKVDGPTVHLSHIHNLWQELNRVCGRNELNRVLVLSVRSWWQVFNVCMVA